ncbi:type III-A CRISPR-associated protein Cas10/Csm1 [Nostoc sp. TCL26-01]|uniref:type III-A CRISPR-associated protein Cas10/Csm1 n=1 Tax=Nostoc sp. TCL26-01 TaxID=2576904 RepID=UPI0015BAC9D0|nr:type III-A CRISPR-associated protein Cas10/Csm1 [Nostoc sp. TCL26-01]QLE58533.1 type III-A CRISPR-associated protein Cas10/Csm1 [Nostoc sp. TCL26-01]
MKDSPTSPKNIALIIAQQGVWAMTKWAGANLPKECYFPEDCDATNKAKEQLHWCDNGILQQPNDNIFIFKPLRLLFDHVKLDKGQDKQYYWEAKAIENKDKYPSIPYPQPYSSNEKPTQDKLEGLKQQIKDEIKHLQLNLHDWENLSLLMMILEKFGSYISFCEADDIALIDIVRVTSAVAAVFTDNSASEYLSLIAGDLSGIQKFIYTISSDGALKSLRARSFYLELVTEEIVQQILDRLDLPRTNVIYAGGGNFYILGFGDLKKVENVINFVRSSFNKWLMTSFKGKIFLAIDYLLFPTQYTNQKEFGTYWKQITTKQLPTQKNRKFEIYLSDFLKQKASYEPCRVCHRDDLPKLKPLKDPDSSPACWVCCKMFELGDKLFKVEAILRSYKSTLNTKLKLEKVYRFYISGTYYFLFEDIDRAINVENTENIFLINNWQLDNYRHQNTIPLLLGNYGQLTQIEGESGYIRAGEIANKAEELGCIPRVGYLRMDVDSLGRIFAEGLDEDKRNLYLLRVAGLSRQMSYFFKVYLNSLADKREENFIKPVNNKLKVLEKAEFLSDNERKNLLFIYAGGDDLFISGSWNEIVEFAFDIYQCFRAYTGHNPDITISGGISIDEPKFPLYQAAKNCQEFEEAAKANKRDSLGLFGEVFKWEEWIKIDDTFTNVHRKTATYLAIEPKPEIFGILDFVKNLTEKLDLGSDYSRNFIRSLLDTAEAQEQMLRKYQEQEKDKKDDIRYYLHLPKLAYALSRLPEKVRNQSEFIPARQSLMNPRNAPYFRAIATWIELLSRSR